MRVATCDHVEVPLPEGHRFPMEKYRLLRELLVAEGVVAAGDLCPAPPAPLADVLRAHDRAYVDAFRAGRLDRRAQSRLGFPWSEALVGRALASVGGTLLAVEAALEDGASGSLAGGTHHAQRDEAAGYCVFNDLAIAALRALDLGQAARVLILDLDVHQGDGTAAILQGEPRAYTCSLHGARNFPLRKAHSDLDVPLPDEAGDGPYLDALDRALATALEEARPELLLVQGGVDVLAADRLGRLALTLEGVAERDQRVVAVARRAGLPMAWVLGGGYAEPIGLSVRAHVNTYRALVGDERGTARPGPLPSPAYHGRQEDRPHR